jgi:hypothetical protein
MLTWNNWQEHFRSNATCELIVKKINEQSGLLHQYIVVGKEKRLVALEVNSSPGSGSKYINYFSPKFNVINGKELIYHFIKFLKNKENWLRKKTILNRIEYITVKDIGKLKAKLDTGNGNYNSLHAENISVKDDKITFTTINNKTFTKSIVDTINIKKDKSKTHYEKRYVVEFDVSFNGIDYENIKFNLTDRSIMLYPVLIGADFLKKINAYVSFNNKQLHNTHKNN